MEGAVWTAKGKGTGRGGKTGKGRAKRGVGNGRHKGTYASNGNGVHCQRKREGKGNGTHGRGLGYISGYSTPSWSTLGVSGGGGSGSSIFTRSFFCKDWMFGNCTRGGSCKSKQFGDGVFFSNSNCSKGDACTFRHLGGGIVGVARVTGSPRVGNDTPRTTPDTVLDRERPRGDAGNTKQEKKKTQKKNTSEEI